MDYEEYIAIFLNGRGIAAQGPIPPGIYGYQDSEKGFNHYIYDWKNGRPQRKSLAEAKRLLAEAGYPNGRDPKTGAPLILNYDVASTSGPDEKSMFAWMRKQFEKLGIQLQIRDTQYNRFQEKMRSGNAQIFAWGWSADYPDPENFLFLLYGYNGKVKFGGENASNYQNAEYDALFEKMKNMPNGPERLVVIEQMLKIVRKDSPWVWGFHPLSFQLSNVWVGMFKPHEVANNTLKYIHLDPKLRAAKRLAWNKPIVWPLTVFLLVLLLMLLPLVISYWRREHTTYRHKKNWGNGKC